MKRCAAVNLAGVLLLCLVVQPASAADPALATAKFLDGLTARPLGPANMGGRIVAVAVVESKADTMYVATASGGLWKTVNNGTTWAPVFEHQATVSLGAVAIAPSDPDIVWAGTGEANARNSVSWGDGVYVSTDGGKTWANRGLRDSQHIGRIVIHPTNPNIVYVAALGHVWGPNKERGLYKTTDGGKTWTQSKYLNDDTGFIELVMDPTDPDVLYAAAYQVRRDRFAGGPPAVQTGPEAGLYKTSDAGKTWTKLTRGLPDRPLGRCGLAISRKDPRLLYAVIQTDRTTEIRKFELGQEGKPGRDIETGGIFRSTDSGQSWTKLNDLCPRPFYYGQIRIDPSDDRRLYVLGVSLHVSADGGRTFRSRTDKDLHADHHALWIDPRNPSHLVLGGDGGLYFSNDRAASWEHLKGLPIGQFYGIAVDMRKPYRIYGGLQDNGSWGGPSATRYREGISTADWFKIADADGFYCQADPTDSDWVYAEGQYATFLKRINVRTGFERDIRPPVPRGQKADYYRFNWCTPLLLSPHNPQLLYFGGNHLLRSPNHGDRWEIISPDLTHGEPGPSADKGHTITTIAESPLKAGVLYVGTDDGRVQVSRNGGAWVDVSDRIPGMASERWITRLECSHFEEGTAYLALDRHRHDDRAPYLFKTTDYGMTWKSLAGNLPAEGPVHVIREDPRRRTLLYAGTEFGLFVSLDGGATWHALNKQLPTVAVHDLVIHPRDRELVIATHGRSLYVMDIAPLQEVTPDLLAGRAHLFEVKPAAAFQYRASRGLGGSKLYVAPNPPYGAVCHYYLREKQTQPVRLVVTDAAGKQVASLPAVGEAGLQQRTWDLRDPAAQGDEDQPPLVRPGEYDVRLEIGDVIVGRRKVRVEADN